MLGTLPRRYSTFRPQGNFSIRRGIPLTENILLAVVWDGVSGWDVVGQHSLVILGGTPQVTGGISGAAGLASTTSVAWGVTNDGPIANRIVRLPTNRVTIAILRRNLDTTARGSGICGWTQVNPTLAGDMQLLAPFSDGNLYWDFGGSSSPNRISVAFTKTVGLETLVAVAGTRGSAVYRNGNRIVSQTTAITRSAAADNSTWSINGAWTLTGDTQEFYLFLVLEQEWTPAQVQEWSNAPYSIFASPRPVFSSTPSAAPSLTAIGRMPFRGSWRGMLRGTR